MKEMTKTYLYKCLMMAGLLVILADLFLQTAKASVLMGLKITDISQQSLYQTKITWSRPSESYDGYLIKKCWLDNQTEYRSYTGVYDIHQEDAEGVRWTIVKAVEGGNTTETVIDTVPGEKWYYCVEGYYYPSDEINLTSKYRLNGGDWYPVYKEFSFDGKTVMGDQYRASGAVFFQAEVPATRITSVLTQKGSNKIFWSSQPEAVSYQIYCSIQNGEFEKIASVSGKTEYVHTGQKAGRIYGYYIKCTYPAGFVSEASNIRSVFIPNNGGKKKIVTRKKIKLAFKSGRYSGNWATSDYTYYYEKGKYFYVVAVNGRKLTEYQLDANMKQKKKKTVKLGKFDTFGGFYHGTDGNQYVALGYSNFTESSGKVVIKVVQYNEKWKKMKTAAIKGGVTNAFKGIYNPFSASGCQMSMQGKLLYLTTGRQMFEGSDGKRHQSNIAFRIQTDTMTATTHNIAYVSHSFNQLTQYVGDTLYQLDHGDAYPRSVVLVISNKDAQKQTQQDVDVKGYTMFKIDGECGNNFTGLKLGGLGVGDENVLAAGIAQPHSYGVKKVTGTGSELAYNVFVSVLDKATGKAEVKWLTTYHPKSAKVTVSEVRMVTLSDDRFALIWNESKTGADKLQYRVLDQKGNVVYKKSYKNVPFDASSQPVLSGGYIKWATNRGRKLKWNYLGRTFFSYPEGKTRLVRIPARY